MDTKVTWQGKLTFTGQANSGFQVPIGGEKEVGGDNDGFRPMELILTGLAGCTAMDVISILGKKRQDVISFEVAVHAERAQEHPKVFTSALIEYSVTGHKIDESAVVRAIELSATRYCPAQAMFSHLMPIRLKYLIFEAQKNNESVLVKSGEYNQSEAATLSTAIS
jgi:putative redox protein